MKTYENIINQTPVYLHNWNEKIDVIGDFENLDMNGEEYRAATPPYPNVDYFNMAKSKMNEMIDKYEDINILFASYGIDNYSGDAWVLFEQYEELYEVNGAHCSCYGLEGQWCPEDVSLKELENRLINGSFGEDTYSGNEFKKELKAFLGITD